ncbi:MAG: PAS domain-containing protein, partial [Planctomycetales bacterium]|nr:PAS domain-containing protein [Planctomycetales bacterium]
IPPKKAMLVHDGKLHLMDKDLVEIPHLPIYTFFKSMAKEYGSECAAIVLSGTGSDGSKGITSVRLSGGLVLCESESTAKFTGMPRNAFQTGCVDFVSPPEAMGKLLQRHVAGEEGESDLLERTDADEFVKIFELMRRECQIDFRHYKPSTVSRRIDRRMSLSDASSLAQYVDLLRNDRSELRRLYQDMLIGVTKFFRDETCFEYIETEVIPALFTRADPARGIRVWVAGCATGEEAYSYAILLEEYRRRRLTGIDFKVFATDVHPDSLNSAATGAYSPDNMSNVSAERLGTFFDKDQDKFVIKPELRRSVVFTAHNVLQDPPFTDLDLISCRNLLIYFDSAAQRKALTLFHFGLRKDGYLLLGPSETIGELGHEFQTVNDRCKLFTKRGDGRLPHDVRLPIRLNARAPFEIPQRWGNRGDLGLRLENYDRLLNTIMPPTIMVDSDRRVIETFGGAEQLLSFPPRMFSNDLLDVAPRALRTPLSAAFRRVLKDQRMIRLPVTNVELTAGEFSSVEITACPLEKRNEANELYAIQITVQPQQPVPSSPPDDTNLVTFANDNQDLIERMRELEEELRHSRENLQATIEELESSNEELQATNEELISSNEELQSTNEELNSVNEELHTVNVEYQNKNAELRELNEDLNHLFSSTDIGTVFLDRSLAVRRFTPRLANIFNLEEQDIGRELAKFTHTLQLDNLHEMIAATMAGGDMVEQEVSDRFGNHYFMRILPYVVDANIAGVILTLTDITTLVAARELAHDSQQRLQDAIDAVPVLVSYINADERYEYANKAYARWLHKQGDGLIGQQVRQVLGDKTYQNISPHIDRVLSGEAQTFEHEIDTHAGPIYLSVSYTPHRLESGKVVGFYVSGADITRVKHAERQLEQTAKLARAANEAKSDFLAKMSHEIRSPMTAILGFADILDGQLKQPDNRDCVDVIRKNGQHLLDLINDILDLSRVESGKLQLEQINFIPADVIRECHNTVLPKANSSETVLVLHITDDLNQVMLGDRRRFRQVVLNLLSNAVKFTGHGQVSVTAERNDGLLQIVVADNGCGIAATELPTIFEPFSQVDNSDTRKYEGSGLGLAITKQLVASMQGTISVTSELGSGSEFTVTLPWRDGSGPPVSDTVELVPQGPCLKGKLIMVIDDRRDVRFIAEYMLRDAGADVETAENGQQGIDLLQRLKAEQRLPDCVVTDIQMPEMDGYETTKRLRLDGYKRPILALTASAMKEEREKCLRAGCTAHMAKPINQSAFVRTINDLVSGISVDDE